MRVRNGFVSNSSSSSFCIYGVVMDRSEVQRRLGIEDVWEANMIDGLDIQCTSNDDCVAIGIEWASIADDETGAQFKARIQTAINKLLGDDVKCCTESDGWYNG